MMNKPLITVIVPVYKVEDYLDECVQSLVNQTYSNLEIILVDDGSPDNCPAMCDSWAKRDHRVRVIHKENGGLSSARNAGIDNARGAYVSFVDSDDFLELDAYERLYEGITRATGIGMSGMKFICYESGKCSVYNERWDTGTEVLVKAKDFGLLTLKQEICHAATNKLYKIEIFDKLRFREGIVNEDVLFSHDLAKEIERMNLDMLDINYYGYYYRIRPGSLCNSEIPIDIPYIENLKTIMNEGGSPEYISTATRIYKRTLYSCYYSLLNDYSEKASKVKEKYLDSLFHQAKQLHYSDIPQNHSKSSVYDRLSFYMVKNHPQLYVLIHKHIILRLRKVLHG